MSPASESLAATDEESKHGLPSTEKKFCPVFIDSLGMDKFLQLQLYSLTSILDISTALMRPKQYCLQLVIYIYIYEAQRPKIYIYIYEAQKAETVLSAVRYSSLALQSFCFHVQIEHSTGMSHCH